MPDFEKSKRMELPREVVVGHDAIKEVSEVCKHLGLPQSAVLVCDENTKAIAGDSVKDQLEDAGYDVDVITVKSADGDTVNTVSSIITEGKLGFAMGVGGGQPIDIAKAASFNVAIPFLSIPTAASHDGIVSSRASITMDGVKKSLDAHTPLGVIADTGIIASSPHKLLAAGCGDIISNLTAVKDWKLAQRLRNEDYSSYAATLSEMVAKILIENASQIRPGLEESAWIVMKGLVSSGVSMSIAGSSRPASGSEHKFSHALDMIAEKPALHGEQCGLGTIMMMYLHGGDWEKIKEALWIIGAPTTAKAAGLSSEVVINALVKAHEIKPERYTILGYKGMTVDAAEALAKTTMVI
ncbi:MAG: NAD(P)-dependent glycerol-1-phosphate dehydrogenase [Thermoplasmata archaeon]|nr:NAD(P)-dependent glycerol-1-phosphate dehydrogenase [Thermoplasmata archaeon]